ncbi:hypothetical protein LEP1GSC062_2604 [Leptospira alexanderi serovar Manhao 3 str. L 60]|uniref:Uncharacterized protein n=1 Tax=Leptospira alexanderi serovar Manhao 3 str. L 60 TaxID=1049759 RepID=V6IBM9_9LEPT|nr:hypothetical protein LEP1GSC062_2604 [Leptospira alexanderi serovar Manhao 3 str. L 60]
MFSFVSKLFIFAEILDGWNHMQKIEFFFEFASTYSYLSVMRIENLLRDLNVEILWRPFC